MRIRRLCPVCGAKMEAVHEESFVILKCTECPLDFGRSWFTRKKELVSAWEHMPLYKKTLGRTKPKAVVKIDQNGNVLERYSSLNEASKKNPMSKTSIENRTRRKLKNEFASCNFSFRLEDDMHQERK